MSTTHISIVNLGYRVKGALHLLTKVGYQEDPFTFGVSNVGYGASDIVVAV